MKQDLYKKVKQFVTDSFTKAGKELQIKHLERTAYWVRQLRPDADEALLIAAVSHDIERAYRKGDVLEKERTIGFINPQLLQHHEERSAQIMAEFLRKEGAGRKLVDRVRMLILKHEEGGNEDQNLLKDADSISFFENNVPAFLTKYALEVGKEKVREKFDWMFNRITSERGRQIARKWYEESIEKLQD